MKTCLLVIDAQESFRQRPYFTDVDLPDYIAAQNALMRACEAHSIAIVRIFHVDGLPTVSNPFAIESGHVRPLDELYDAPMAATFYKSRHSALVGTGLGVWLRQNSVEKLSSAVFAQSSAARPLPAMPAMKATALTTCWTPP